MSRAPDRLEILFAHAYFANQDPHPVDVLRPLPPLQPAEVAAWVQQEADARVALWDSTFRVSLSSFDVAISRMRPSIAWLHTHPTTRTSALEMVERARLSGAVVVAAGPDASRRPRVYLEAGADAVASGEAEEATLQLLLALRSSHYRPSVELLSQIPGIHYLDAFGRPKRSAGKERLVDLGRLPGALREPEQVRIQLENWRSFRGFRTLGLSSGRGCPNDCGFCSRTVSGRPYRRRDPRVVVDTMQAIDSQFDVDRLRFMDELFLVDPHWLEELVGELGRRSFSIPFEGTAHPGLLDSGSLRGLASAGLCHVELQAASGSARLLRSLNWSYEPGDIYRAAAVLADAGVACSLQLLVGLPGETAEDLDASMEMVRLVEPAGVEVTRVDPGSPALFRNDWERLVEGPLAELGLRSEPLPEPVLRAAVSWMRSVGSGTASGPVDNAGNLVDRVRRPLLRGLVRASPWIAGLSAPLRRGRTLRSRLLPPESRDD